MMKRYLLFFLMVLVGFSALGQDAGDYYQLPDRSRQYKRLLMRYGGPSIQDRWYVAADGFVRTDRADLTNSLDGLISSDHVAKVGFGVTIGYVYRERWAVEGGYARMPVHSQVSISNGAVPLAFTYSNNKNAFVMRAKRLVLSTSGPWLRSGFWLGGGVWLVPNNGQKEGHFSLIGYRYRGRSEPVDTMRLTSQTVSTSRITGLAELTAEYNVRLSSQLDLGFSVRRFWGLGSALTTDVSYTVNNQAPQLAQLNGTGTGMSYGVTLRYTYALRRELPRVLEIHGKQSIR